MKIAIIGAGISGLSTYLYLRKHLPATTSLTIYESYPFPSRTSARNTTSASFIGGGLGVAPNGMRALRALSSSLHASVMAQGVPVPRFVFKTAGGRILGVMPTIDPAGPGREEEAMVMSSRTGLWECLLEMVPAEAVVWGREVRGVNKVREGEMRIVFEDETVEDGWALVVGADGIWSKVRKELVGDGEAVKPEYQGLFGVGGFVPSRLLNHESTSDSGPPDTVMTFGGTGFFGYGPCISESATSGDDAQSIWWSTWSHEDPSVKPTTDELQVQLRKNHAHWADPTIRRIVEDAQPSLTVATWVMPKLVTWRAEGIVLVGDAAHALPSTSGQGCSAAFQDAQALALLLAHYLSLVSPAASTSSSFSHTASTSAASPKPLSPHKAIDLATHAYELARKPHVEGIRDQSMRMGNQKKKKGVVGEWVMYAALWVMFKFFSGILTKPLSEYEVEKEVEKVIRRQEKDLGLGTEA